MLTEKKKKRPKKKIEDGKEVEEIFSPCMLRGLAALSPVRYPHFSRKVHKIQKFAFFSHLFSIAVARCSLKIFRSSRTHNHLMPWFIFEHTQPLAHGIRRVARFSHTVRQAHIHNAAKRPPSYVKAGCGTFSCSSTSSGF